MSMIAMAVYDTVENERTKYTRETLDCLMDTVDLQDHRIIVIDNASCKETKDLLLKYGGINIITNTENVGTAKAINQAWKWRMDFEHLIKMDNDCVINYTGWVDEMEDAIERDPSIGILGLKRKDLFENPWRNDQFKSTLRMLPHREGQRWIIVEDVQHVMGTCQMYNWRLIDKIGGMMQPRLYGFDDTLSAVRCHVAGFKNSFLPHIEIDHIDDGKNPYTEEKRKAAMEDMATFNAMKDRMLQGQQSIYVAL